MINNKKKVSVIGHKNPDIDSICSAIGYAYFKNITEKRYQYIPLRSGKMDKRIELLWIDFLKLLESLFLDIN